MQQQQKWFGTNHGRLAIRDFYENCNFTVDEIREKLAHRVDHPDAETCDWCGIAGLPNDVDRCPVCRRNLTALRQERLTQRQAEAEMARSCKAQGLRRALASYWIAFGSSVLLAAPMQLSWKDAIAFIFVVTLFGGFFIQYGVFRAVYWSRDVARPWAKRVFGAPW